MINLTRRSFLQSALIAGSAASAAASRIEAIEPVRRVGKSHIRSSMAAYSFRQYLGLNIKPRPPMALEDFIEFAARINLDAVELTAYYFSETSAQYLANLKGKCTRLGLDVSGTAVGNNFCTSDPGKLREQINYVKGWVDHSSRLGAKTIRIFAGNMDKGDTEEKAKTRCVDAIQEACDYAGKAGIYLALENHGGITTTIDQTLALVRAVKHDWFGVNFDTGNFHTVDPYADLVRLAPYAVTVQIKSEIQRSGLKKEEADLSRLIGILRTSGYRGYVALEYEAEEDPKTAVPRIIESLKPLMG